ncbi:hypothetical protein ONZ43_g1624 [Nemania bipapillata]|uniref:Uncharacterized protein n=1 Tax=Nemania bipapillata TaxID=110536 RepID=A0ACC2J3N6_9PEZI|nr:hypothetical protein ONZ43_g1624 [Nemania bipapillata]
MRKIGKLFSRKILKKRLSTLSQSTEPPLEAGTQLQPLHTSSNILSRPPNEASASETIPASPAASPPTSDAVQPDQHANEPRVPEPYASNSDLWNTALKDLQDTATRESIEIHIGRSDGNARSLAEDIERRIDAAVKIQQHDSRTARYVENAVKILKGFSSAADVAVSYNPMYAAVPWAIVRSVLVCDAHQQLYMAPDLALRPPEVALKTLKKSIIQVYTEIQLFLGFAIQQLQNRTRRIIAAPLRLGDVKNHIDELIKCQHVLIRAADDCEKHCNLLSRSSLEQFVELQAEFRGLMQTQIELVLEKIDQREHEEMLNWISPILSSDCREQLLESVTVYPQTTLLLDALDECEPGSRSELLEIIDYLLKSGSLIKVFISSRADRDIRNRLRDTDQIEIQATDNEGDIKKFVEEEIIKHENWSYMSVELRNLIMTTLFTKSQGMFQWAFLQIKQILLLESEEAILDRLGKLPPDLKTAYDEIYDKVKSHHKHDRVLADNAFKWVAAACKPLASDTLLPAIRLDSQQVAFHLSGSISESQLLHLCNNLLVLDSKLKVWRFSHLSVIEYFETNHWNLAEAHGEAAK